MISIMACLSDTLIQLSFFFARAAVDPRVNMKGYLIIFLLRFLNKIFFYLFMFFAIESFVSNTFAP